MAWTDGVNAGFTNASAAPYLPLDANYATINVEVRLFPICVPLHHVRLHAPFSRMFEMEI